jgi:hypothetical protein
MRIAHLPPGGGINQVRMPPNEHGERLPTAGSGKLPQQFGIAGAHWIASQVEAHQREVYTRAVA